MHYKWRVCFVKFSTSNTEFCNKSNLIIKWLKGNPEFAQLGSSVHVLTPSANARSTEKPVKATSNRKAALSMRPADGEFDRVAERVLPGRRRKELERVESHRAVMAGALDRVFERTVLLHRRKRNLEIAIDDFALLERPAPEVALMRRPAPERQHHGNVILPSRKSSPTFLPSLADEPP